MTTSQLKIALRRFVRDNVKYGPKHLIWDHLQRYTPGALPDICIFTTRRSGATWVTDMLSMEKGMMYSAGPLRRGGTDPWLLRRRVFPLEIIGNGRVPIRGRDDEWMFDVSPICLQVV